MASVAETNEEYRPGEGGRFERALIKAMHRAIRGQADAAEKYVARLRKANPDAPPADILRMLDRRYLTAVTASGSAVGASGAVPGIGTMVALGAIGGESIVFLEATAFYVVATAAVHGHDSRDDEAREVLVMTVMMGASGTALLSSVIGNRASGRGGTLAGRLFGLPALGQVRRRMQGGWVRRFATKRAALSLGKLAPAGVGAVIGGWGNRRLGRTVVSTARETFGEAPATWPPTV